VELLGEVVAISSHTSHRRLFVIRMSVWCAPDARWYSLSSCWRNVACAVTSRSTTRIEPITVGPEGSAGAVGDHAGAVASGAGIDGCVGVTEAVRAFITVPTTTSVIASMPSTVPRMPVAIPHAAMLEPTSLPREPRIDDCAPKPSTTAGMPVRPHVTRLVMPNARESAARLSVVGGVH
jgi:hypothetical protein